MNPTMILPDPVAMAIPAFILLVLAEVAYCRLRGISSFELRDTAASLIMGLGNFAFGLAWAGAIYGAMAWVHHYRVFDIPHGWGIGLIAFPAIFIADDFCYYWFHRLSHRHRIWWAAHVNHHSSQHYNLSTALRQTWTGDLALTWIVWLPLALIGFAPELIAFAKGVSLVYQFWIHTETIAKLPRWIEAVFNTPSHHRVHHATNPRYLDRNYAGALIVWDKLFGTFVPETAAEPCRYGIVKNIGTFNPLRIALHEWVAIARDVARARTWSARLMHVLGPPGWKPDGQGRTSAAIHAAWAARQRAGLSD